MTPPAFPTLPAWMCAAAARPESFENVRRQVSLTRSESISTALPVKRPVAPVGTPVGFGTSNRALRLAVTLNVSRCGAASANPASANPAKPSAVAAPTPSVFLIGPP